jgi:acyl-CoA dehydrogenase
MSDSRYLHLPFFEPRHATLAGEVDRWAAPIAAGIDHHDTDAACRAWVRALGEAGWLRYCVPVSHGGALPVLESRSLCLLRETLARHDGLADFAFAMQGLGSGPITLAGSDALRARWLPRIARGEAIAAFALSEPDAGSDVAAMATRARRAVGDDGRAHWVLDGSKTWISNGGIADFYVTFARTSEGDGPDQGARHGARGISAFVVEADAPGLSIAERIDVVAPHPLATLAFDGCRVPESNLLGEVGGGFKLAMSNLDIFRSSVAAAALGFARRALDEGLAHAQGRRMFGGVLADFQLTQAALADMATDIDASMLLTYRAAWLRDTATQRGAPGERQTREAAMAKMVATESAQRVIDSAVQLFGGLGVKKGSVVESLYREIRALRIYEGATEVQKLIIGRDLLKAGA